MARKLLIATLLIATLTSAQHRHVWVKDAEFTDDNRKVVCIWKCASNDGATRTTSGYGACPYPF